MMRRFLYSTSLLLAALFCVPAKSAISVTLVAALSHSSGATSIGLITTGACASGSKLIEGARYGGPVTSISVSDSRGNTYATTSGGALVWSTERGFVSTSDVGTTIQVGDTITTTWTGSVTNDIGAICVAGLNSGGTSIDVQGQLVASGGNGVTGTGTTVAGLASGTLSQASEFLFGFTLLDAFVGSYTSDAGHGWTSIGGAPSGSRNSAFDYQIVSATTSVANAPTFTSGTYAAGIWSWKGTGGGAPVQHNMTMMGVGN